MESMALGSFFYGGGERGWVKMLATTKKFKITPAETSWNSIKRFKFATKIPKINDSKLNMWSLSFTLRFSGRKSQSQQKLAEKIIHFTIQFD